MTRSGSEDVDLVGHRYRSHCRPGAGAGSGEWDIGTGAECETDLPDFHNLASLGRWGRLDSNQRPTDYESAALTN